MENYKLPLDLLYHWEKESPDKIYLRQPVAGKWLEYSWQETAQEVRKMAAYLKARNFPPGSHIGILSKNCAHWLMADLAIWMAGHASVPLYPNLSAATVRQIIEHSEMKFLFLGKLDDWAGIKSGVPSDLPCVSFPYQSPEEHPRWDRALEGQAPLAESPSRKHSDVATIIYTSGTTGQPKGVIHQFLAMALSGTEISRKFAIGENDSFFSYLPLAHVAERLLIQIMGIYSGGTVSFAESLDKFADNLRETQPTLFLGVPRIWTKFQGGVLQKLPQQKLDRLLGLPIVSLIIRHKIKKALGLSRCRYAITGAAPIPVALLEWYGKLGLDLLEAYGMTENFAYSHVNHLGKVKKGTVGQAWPLVEHKIGENHELLVKSLCTTPGYFKDAALTAETVRNGYLHTGDQADIDSQGYVKITGRVKDLFKTAKGKYVVPGPIEMRLASSPFLEQICVVGSGMPQPLALAVLSEPGKTLDSKKLSSELEAVLDQCNALLDPHERLAKLVITSEAWGIDNGLLTPTLKVKRNAVEKRFQPRLEGWFETPGQVIFG